MYWAVNKMKLERAINLVGKDAPEASILEQYIKLGGLVSSDYKNVATGKISANAERLEEVSESESALIEMKAKNKGGRPKKNV